MKTLNLEQMECVEGGRSTAATVGIMCAATLVFSMSVVFAPFAGATGVGCAVGLYALNFWSDQGVNIDTV